MPVFQMLGLDYLDETFQTEKFTSAVSGIRVVPCACCCWQSDDRPVHLTELVALAASCHEHDHTNFKVLPLPTLFLRARIPPTVLAQVYKFFSYLTCARWFRVGSPADSFSQLVLLKSKLKV